MYVFRKIVTRAIIFLNSIKWLFFLNLFLFGERNLIPNILKYYLGERHASKG